MHSRLVLLTDHFCLLLFSSRDMRNAFNTLLVLLATVDSFLICFAIFDHSIIRAWKVSELVKP